MKATCLRVTTIALILTLGAAFVPAPAFADGGDLKSAMDDYAAGEFDTALEKLRAYVASNPSETEVYEVLRVVEDRVLLRALTKGGEHERQIKWLLDRARPQAERDSMSSDEIKAAAKTAVEDSAITARRRAQVRLRVAGDLAVPHLYGYLGADSADTVVNAILALKQLGSDATEGLVEVLNSDNAGVRGYAAAVLGEIGDSAALPAVMALGNDGDQAVQAKASRALETMGGSSGGVFSGGAASAFVELGNRYFNKDLSLARDFKSTRNLWRWSDGSLKRMTVPYYLWHYQMAEECAADAMAIDPNAPGAASLLARALLAQQLEGAARGEDAPEALGGSMALAQSLGYDAANEALRDSINGGHWDVAGACCDLVKATYGGESLAGSALNDAMQSNNKQLRSCAAIALIEMNAGGIGDAGTALGLVAQAASESAVRQVLVIDDRDETRGQMVRALTGAGYVAMQESNGALGVARAKSSPSADVIIVRADLGDQANTIPSARLLSSLAVIDELGRDPRTTDMSLVVLVQDTPESKKDVVRAFLSEKYGDAIKAYVDAPVVEAAFLGEIAAAAEARDLNADREQANSLAARAAAALASMDANDGALNVGVAVEPLSTAATSGPTAEIRMNAVKALGNLRAGGAEALVKVLTEGEGDELRAAAASALGSVMAKVSGGAEAVEALMTAAGGDGAIATAALKALGHVSELTPAQRLEVFRKHRLAVASDAE